MMHRQQVVRPLSFAQRRRRDDLVQVQEDHNLPAPRPSIRCQPHLLQPLQLRAPIRVRRVRLVRLVEAAVNCCEACVRPYDGQGDDGDDELGDPHDERFSLLRVRASHHAAAQRCAVQRVLQQGHEHPQHEEPQDARGAEALEVGALGVSGGDAVGAAVEAADKLDHYWLCWLTAS
jgi:hypothetical protein